MIQTVNKENCTVKILENGAAISLLFVILSKTDPSNNSLDSSRGIYIYFINSVVTSGQEAKIR